MLCMWVGWSPRRCESGELRVSRLGGRSDDVVAFVAGLSGPVTVKLSMPMLSIGSGCCPAACAISAALIAPAWAETATW